MPRVARPIDAKLPITARLLENGRPRLDPAASYAAETIRPMARAGFIPLFATFPVDYLDEDLCVFVFPLFGTRIVAVREGSPIARDLSEIIVTD